MKILILLAISLFLSSCNSAVAQTSQTTEPPKEISNEKEIFTSSTSAQAEVSYECLGFPSSKCQLAFDVKLDPATGITTCFVKLSVLNHGDGSVDNPYFMPAYRKEFQCTKPTGNYQLDSMIDIVNNQEKQDMYRQAYEETFNQTRPATPLLDNRRD